MLSDKFKEKSLNLVVIALPVLKLFDCKVGAGLKRPANPLDLGWVVRKSIRFLFLLHESVLP